MRRLNSILLEKTAIVTYLDIPKEYSIKIQRISHYLRRIIRKVAKVFGEVDDYREGKEGNWYGNDTIWRTIGDLNKILYYCGKDGKIQDSPQRKVLTFVDGVVAGDCEGPMQPRKREIGLLCAGFSTFMVDYTCAGIVGFDWEKLPFLKGILQAELNKNHKNRISIDPDDVVIVFNGNELKYNELIARHNKCFEAPIGWKGHVEV